MLVDFTIQPSCLEFAKMSNSRNVVVPTAPLCGMGTRVSLAITMFDFGRVRKWATPILIILGEI